MIIRTPSRVSQQTFINFVYLYVNKQFKTQTLLKVAPQGGTNDVKSGPTRWGMMLKNEKKKSSMRIRSFCSVHSETKKYTGCLEINPSETALFDDQNLNLLGLCQNLV
jgi:hypothetical protein